MITQTWAMAVDAYRELHARKLFWVTLGLSALVVLVFAAVGIDEKGVSILGLSIESQFLNTQYISPGEFYRTIFVAFGLGLWLTWIAAILALVSTAGVFPALITGGSIDLWLSRPISRWRLFITKFLLGLAFVVLQVTVFTAASFLVLGLRGGVWEPSIFLAIPLVTIFFSYLFAICVLAGVVTRSTIAALLITLLAWFGIFLVHATESTLLQARIFFEMEIESIDRDIERSVAANEVIPAALEEERTKAARTNRWIVGVHRGAYVLKTGLPKTDETINLLSRAMVDLTAAAEAAPPGADNAGSPFSSRRISGFSVAREFAARMHVRPVWWVLGTSLLFVTATAGLAGWLFCRRDY